MRTDTLDLGGILLLGAAVLLVALLAIRVSSKLGLPSLLVYLGIGLLIGESGIVGVQFDDTGLARLLGFSALALILTEGGFTTQWSKVRDSMAVGVVLSTVGVAISAALVGVFAHLVIGLDLRTALLLGAITASTDAAAVFSVLRKVPLRRRLAGTLEVESGMNDAPAVILVTLLVTSDPESTTLWGVVADVLWQLGAGAAVGLAIGFIGAFLVRRLGFGTWAPSALAVLGLAFAAYGVADQVGASGFVAIYVASLVLGNSRLPHRRATRSFSEGLAWFAQIGLFVMLGILAWPDRLSWTSVGPALVVGLVLTLVARPVSVVACALPFRMPWREQAFLGWTGLRGAVPIVLATIPMAGGVADSALLFDIVLVLVVVFTLMQAPTLPMMARWLRVEQTTAMEEVDVEVAPLQRLDAELLEFTIGERSRLAGVEVGELRLPDGASVALVVRGRRAEVPRAVTVLRAGDEVVVLAGRNVRAATEERLREVSRYGRLAGWRAPRPGSTER